MSKKIYSAVFKRDGDEVTAPTERVEYFCDKDFVSKENTFSVEDYANNFLMHQGETLEDILEEDPITDTAEIQDILGEALNYIHDVCENNGFDCGDVAQNLEKLLVSHIATT